MFGSTIQILRGDSSAYAVGGDTLIASNQEDITQAVEKNSNHFWKTDQLIAHVDEILSNVKAVFEDETTQGLPTAFKNLQRTVVTLENTALHFDSLVVENRAIFKNVIRTSMALRQISTSITTS